MVQVVNHLSSHESLMQKLLSSCQAYMALPTITVKSEEGILERHFMAWAF